VSVRTRVYEFHFPINQPFQLMVEDFDDGHQTIAFKLDDDTSWGSKHRPVMDDDGDHLREPEHLPVISDDEYAKYLNGESM